MSTAFQLATLPAPCTWRLAPQDWHSDGTGTLTITAGPQCDLFHDPATSGAQDNAPSALFDLPAAPFQLSAYVTVEMAATFDAGALHLRTGDETYVKLCLERSPQGEPMVVSVVTRGRSDDCNSTVLPSPAAYLRIAANGVSVALHYSLDRRFWHMVRYCTIGPLVGAQAGFSAQSPSGERCTAVFSQIAFKEKALTDLRGGE